MGKILTVYYSRRGENYWPGGLRMLEKGNTEIAAETVRAAVGGDIFEVDTVIPYPEQYTACTRQARQELEAGYRPELKACPESLEEYDTIFIGYPNWCGTLPVAMFAFLEKYDLSDKRIIPFCTNEGSGMGVSETDLKKTCPSSKIERGLPLRGSQVETSKSKITAWAKGFF